MGGACSVYGERRQVYMVWGNLKERVHLGDTGVDGRIILKKDVQDVGCGGVDWIDLAHHSDSWRVRVNAVMNVGVKYNAGIS